MKPMRLLLLIAALAFSNLLPAAANEREISVLSYNVENLFDIDGIANYGEYVPGEYSANHLLTKVKNTSPAFSRRRHRPLGRM